MIPSTQRFPYLKITHGQPQTKKTIPTMETQFFPHRLVQKEETGQIQNEQQRTEEEEAGVEGQHLGVHNSDDLAFSKKEARGADPNWAVA
jgi:hypothetical protein